MGSLWDDLEEGLTYEQEERLAIQGDYRGLTGEEAMAAFDQINLSDTNESRSDCQPSDKHESNMTHFSRHNSGGIPAIIDLPVSDWVGTGAGCSNIAGSARARIDVEKQLGAILPHIAALPPASGSHIPILTSGPKVAKNNDTTDDARELEAKMGETPAYQWVLDSHCKDESHKAEKANTAAQNIARDPELAVMNSDPVRAAAGDLRVETVAGILRAHYSVSQEASKPMALSILTLAHKEGIRDIYGMLEMLSLKWAMQLHGEYACKKPGEWLFRELVFYAKKERESKALAIPRAAVNWQKLRSDVIDCARDGGSPMPRKLFMDYYWHVKKSGAPFDREVIAAYKALEAAKVLMRSTAGIEVRADPVRLPEKKSSYTYESALAHLREVVMRGYGVGEDAWEAAADQALPYIDWRRQRSPEALLGIADAIQERTKK